MEDKVIVILDLQESKATVDLEVPVDITINEFILAIANAYNIKINSDEFSQTFLKTENPIALLSGTKTIRKCKIRNGTIIHIN